MKTYFICLVLFKLPPPCSPLICELLSRLETWVWTLEHRENLWDTDKMVSCLLSFVWWECTHGQRCHRAVNLMQTLQTHLNMAKYSARVPSLHYYYCWHYQLFKLRYKQLQMAVKESNIFKWIEQDIKKQPKAECCS